MLEHLRCMYKYTSLNGEELSFCSGLLSVISKHLQAQLCRCHHGSLSQKSVTDRNNVLPSELLISWESDFNIGN